MNVKSKKVKPPVLRRSLYSRLEKCYVTETKDIEILYLSPLTQISIGCRIGQEITTLKPWIYVQKEKFLDHIEFYEAESEFYKVQNKIQEYPREMMMIGSCNFNAEIEVDFFLCVSVEAQEHVENIIKLQEQLQLQNVLKSLNPVIGPWYSFGSEQDIQDESNRNNRMLLAVDIESDFPIHHTSTQFHLVESCDYVELSGKSGRFLLRTRLDRGTQVAPFKTNQSCQTNTCLVRDTITQYEYIQPQINQKFKLKCGDELCDILNVNYHINLYENEYSRLTKNQGEVSYLPPIDKKLYQDNKSCRRTKVSCLSWNTEYSGVVAVAYAKNPPLCLIKKRNLETVADPSTETHLILIWCFEDNVRPKLYLEAGDEVSSLSFCPYDGNILVAGYRNGLLAVWDLTNLIARKIQKKFLSAQELEYHLWISSQSDWIKQPLTMNYLRPILRSPVTEASPVTSILWIPPTYRITRLRKYEEGVGMQFITTSLTGTGLYVWDLTNPKKIRRDRSSRKGRLSGRPPKLCAIPSKLQNINFTPICRLRNNTPHPLIKIVSRNDFYLYENGHPSGLKFNFDSSQQLVCSTLSGCVKIIQWDDGQYLGDDRPVTSRVYGVVHDGPVLDCEMNSVFPEMVLTVGGSVFAIWDVNMEQPLIWRKSLNRYQSGMWCVHHPLSVLVVRTDRFFEFWNFVDRSDKPVQLFKYHGYDMIKIYGDSTKFQARKKCFITSDALGNFKLVLLPKEHNNDTNIKEAKLFLAQLYRFKQYIIELKMKCHPFQALSEDVSFACSEGGITVIPKKQIIVKPTPAEIFNRKQHIKMAKILLENKGINLMELSANKQTCLTKYELTLPEKRINPDDVLKMADDQLTQIMKNIIVTNKVRRRLHVTINYDNFQSTKKQYFNSYQEIKREFTPYLGKIKCKYSSERWSNLRKKYEIMARNENKFLKRNVTVETEVASSSP